VAVPLGRLPAEVRGRDALLAELRHPLSRRHRGPGRAWVLTGMGGLGKSTVALATAEFALTRGWRVWWVTATDTASLTGGMLEILRQLSAPEAVTQPVREGAPTAAERAWEFLNDSRQSGQRWLLILDNADAPAVLAADATGSPADHAGWLRPDPSGMVIVTTRVKDPKAWGPRVILRELPPLDDTTAGQVLADLAPGITDPSGEQAMELGRRLGGLPLALHLAGSYLASPFARWHNFADYRRTLDGTELPAALADLDDPGVHARATIQQTWDLSLDALAAERRPQARPLLFLLSCYAPATPIPVVMLQPELLARLLAEGGQSSADTAIDIDAERQRRLRDGLQSLATVGLIDIAGSDGQTAAQGVTVHPVVADANRSRLLTTSRSDLPAIGETAVRLLQAAVGSLDRGRPTDWSAWRSIVPHMTALLEWLAPHLGSETLSSLLIISGKAADALLRSGGHAAAERLARISVTASLRLGDDHPASLAARQALAQSIEVQGCYGEAEQQDRQILADRRRILGDDHPDTLNTRYRLARAIALQGRNREAEQLFGALLADQRRILGDEHPSTVGTRHRLARAIADQGRYGEAEQLYRQILADRSRVLGDDHPDTLGTRSNLARAIGGQMRYVQAEQLYRQLLADRSRVLGDDHPDTLTTRHRLALVIGHQGRYAEAEDLCGQVLADRQRILGGDHPNTLNTRHRLAHIIAKAGRPRQAEQLCRQVLADRKRILGDHHPDTLVTRHKLAQIVADQGRYGEAEQLCRQVLADRKRILGDDHPDTLAARQDLMRLIGPKGQTTR
jgi:tetratricopeptide (TPR) repeat protein